MLAGLREVRRHVVRILRALVVLQMATDACRGGEVVIVVDVAIGALPGRYSVRAGQGETGG